MGGNFLDDMLVVTGGIGQSALRFALPGAEDFGTVAGGARGGRGRCQGEEEGAGKDTGKGAVAGPGPGNETGKSSVRARRPGQSSLWSATNRKFCF